MFSSESSSSEEEDELEVDEALLEPEASPKLERLNIVDGGEDVIFCFKISFHSELTYLWHQTAI